MESQPEKSTVAKSTKPRRKKCRGGQPQCKNYVNDYKDVEGVGCCETCDKYIDDNPYDPYWEQMADNFSYSDEYKELEKNNLVEDTDAYEEAYEKFQANYEPWPVMRRRMSKKGT